MKKWNIIGLLLIGACTFQACDKDDIDEGDETEFVSKAAVANTFEVEAGELAAIKGQSSAVKSYGNQMMTEHMQVRVELKMIASDNGIAVPEGMDEEHTRMYNELNAKMGADFDKAYAQMMVDTHKRTVNLFDEAGDDLDNPEIKKFAQDKLPTLKLHYDQAVALKATVNP